MALFSGVVGCSVLNSVSAAAIAKDYSMLLIQVTPEKAAAYSAPARNLIEFMILNYKALFEM